MNSPRSLVIGIVAGEPSGDLLGGALIKAILHIYPNATFVGIAGEKMKACGAKTLFPMEKISVMGFSEVISRLFELLSLRNKVKKYFLENPPDIYIGIDSPDFNLNIEKALKKMGIFTVHYNSPTIWAWRKGRIKTIEKSVDMMLCLFPFEKKYYEHTSVEAVYIGHPLADLISAAPISYKDIKKIALLPGSRNGEIKYLAPVLLESAKCLFKKYPQIIFNLPMVNEEKVKFFKEIAGESLNYLPINITIGNAQTVMRESDLVILASGTATLEALLLGCPMVVVYKSSWLSHWIAKCLIKIPYVSLPNILAGKKIVPELIQSAAIPMNIVREVDELITSLEKIKTLQEQFLHIHQSLSCNAAATAAKVIADKLSLRYRHD